MTVEKQVKTPKRKKELNAELLKLYEEAKQAGVKSSSPKKLASEYKSCVSDISNLLLSVDELTPAQRRQLYSILFAETDIFKPAVAKRVSELSPQLSTLLKKMAKNPALYNFYINRNFNLAIITRHIGKISDMRSLLLKVLSQDRDKVKALITTLSFSQGFKTLGAILENSDPLTRELFVKAVLPSLLMAAFSPSQMKELMYALREATHRTKNHREFFLLLDKVKELIFLFGALDEAYIKDIIDCMR